MSGNEEKINRRNIKELIAEVLWLGSGSGRKAERIV